MRAGKARLISSAILLIALTVEGSYGQTLRNQQQQSGKTSPAQQPTGDQQQVGAPFYSIKDGKTSARRIQQQQPSVARANQLVESQQSDGVQSELSDFATTSTVGSTDADSSFSTTLSSTGQSNGANLNRQQTDQLGSMTQSNLPESAFMDSTGRVANSQRQPSVGQQQPEMISQKQMNIGSFNQLLEQAALDDFMSSGQQGQQQVAATTNRSSELAGAGEPTQQTSLNGDFQPTTMSSTTTSTAGELGSTSQQQVDSSPASESSADSANNNQVPFQFTTATGATSSISMSLDGMMVNSRPRASVNSLSSTADSQWASSGTKKAPGSQTARLGDQQNFGNFDGSSNQNQAGKASRRVPFSGIPFSSPASKGQRTRPKASNQLGLVSGQAPTGSTFEVMTAVQLNSDSSPQQRPQVRQENRNRQMDSFSGPNPSDFEQEEQVKVDNNNRQQLDANSVELMKSLLGSAGLQGGHLEGSFTKASNVIGNGNDDMLMSVVSSADGKERRLVMIARNTLDALQKYAAAMQPGIKGTQRQVARKQPARQQQQIAVGQIAQQGGNWWPNNQNGQNNRNNQNSFSASTSVQQQQQPQVANQQQEEVRVQTTTLSPLNFGGSPTTQQIQIGFTSATSQTPAITQESVQVDGNSSQVPSIDTFREVPVSSIDNQRADAQVKRPQQQQRGSQAGATKQVSAQSKSQNGNLASSTGGGRNAAGGQQKVASAPSDGGVQSKQKVTNKQSSGSSGGQKSGSSKNSATNGKSGKRTGSVGNKQATGSAASNGKQQRLEAGKANVKTTGKTAKQSPKSSTNKAPSLSSGSVTTNGQQQPSRSFGGSDGSQVVDQPARQSTSEATLDGASPSSTMKPRSVKEGFGAAGRKDSKQQMADEQGTTTTTPTTPTTTTASVSIRGRPVATESISNSDANLDQQLDELERAKMIDNASPTRSGSQKASPPLSAADQLENLRVAIPGEPQLDYPIHATPPRTAFDCRAQSCPAGYYADMEAQCQVFHVCQNDGRSDTFLCPNGTIFSQQHFVCVWWWQVDCQQSASFYKLNDGIYCNSAFPGSTSSPPAGLSSALSSGLNPMGGAQLLLAGGFGAPNRTNDGLSTSMPTTDGDLADNQSGSGADNSQDNSSTAANQKPGEPNKQTSGSSESQSGSGPSILADADLNQQQQQQLELLAKRA